VNNIFEAISTGAVEMVHVIGAIISNLIAFVAIFSFLDATCVWFFSMLGLESFGLAVSEYIIYSNKIIIRNLSFISRIIFSFKKKEHSSIHILAVRFSNGN
jgi:hypothetical protein